MSLLPSPPHHNDLQQKLNHLALHHVSPIPMVFYFSFCILVLETPRWPGLKAVPQGLDLPGVLAREHSINCEESRQSRHSAIVSESNVHTTKNNTAQVSLSRRRKYSSH